MKPVCLSELSEGGSALVERLTATGPIRRRLLDLGLTPGTRVTCVGCSPAGDPSAYLIRGAVIALRRRDAGGIQIETGRD